MSQAKSVYSTTAPRRRSRPAIPASSSKGLPFPDASFPDIYAMTLSGDCLSPELLNGDEVKFASIEQPKPGDLCNFVLRPELVKPGGVQCTIKRLVLAPPPWVRFPWRENPKSDVLAIVIVEQLNPHCRYTLKCSDLLAIHKFVGIQHRKGAR